MMAVVKVLPQWAPRFGFTFSYCIWCAGSDDERPSLHHPFASAMSGVPFDCHEHQMPPSNAKPFAILVRPRTQGYKVLHSLPSSFTQPPGGILEAMRLAELPEAVSAPLEFAPRKHFFVSPKTTFSSGRRGNRIGSGLLHLAMDPQDFVAARK